MDMEFSAIGPRGWVEFAPCIAIKKDGMTELGGGSRCPLQVQSYLFSFYILTLTLLTLTLIITLTLTLTQARPNHNRRRKGSGTGKSKFICGKKRGWIAIKLTATTEADSISR